MSALEPSFWFAEGYSVGRYDTPPPSREDAQLLAEADARDFIEGLRAGWDAYVLADANDRDELDEIARVQFATGWGDKP
jgi:hypothetical protein